MASEGKGIVDKTGEKMHFRYATPDGDQTTKAIIAAPQEVLLCLDFDGTLAPIVSRPEDARPEPRSIQAISRLLGHMGLIAIVTGRPVEVALQLGGFAQLPDTSQLRIYGQYGDEQWDGASGHISVPPQPTAITEAKDQLERIVDEVLRQQPAVRGTHIEDKGLSIGVHTRQAENPSYALEILFPRLANLADRLGLIAEPGRNVVELRASSTNKGMVVKKLLAEQDFSSVAFCGDDLGDITAFKMVSSWRGTGKFGARVVSASQEVKELTNIADVVCAGTSGIADWLTYLADRIEG